MCWIDAENKRPEYPCVVVDAQGNVELIRSVLTIVDDGKKFYLDVALFSRYFDELHNKTKIKMCIWENRIRYWMPLPDAPNDIKQY